MNSNNEVESIFVTNKTLCVTFINATHVIGQNPERALLKLPFVDEMNGKIDPSKVQVMYPESGFAINFIRALSILFAWLGILAALGLLLPDLGDPEAPPEMVALAEKRQEARAAKDWAGADAVRDELKKLGWTVKDGQNGYELKPL